MAYSTCWMFGDRWPLESRDPFRWPLDCLESRDSLRWPLDCLESRDPFRWPLDCLESIDSFRWPLDCRDGYDCRCFGPIRPTYPWCQLGSLLLLSDYRTKCRPYIARTYSWIAHSCYRSYTILQYEQEMSTKNLKKLCYSLPSQQLLGCDFPRTMGWGPEPKNGKAQDVFTSDSWDLMR